LSLSVSLHKHLIFSSATPNQIIDSFKKKLMARVQKPTWLRPLITRILVAQQTFSLSLSLSLFSLSLSLFLSLSLLTQKKHVAENFFRLEKALSHRRLNWSLIPGIQPIGHTLFACSAAAIDLCETQNLSVPQQVVSVVAIVEGAIGNYRDSKTRGDLTCLQGAVCIFCCFISP
jgi:hypothetical protein